MKGGRCKFGLLALLFLMLMTPDFVYSRSYPIYTSKRFGNADSRRIPALSAFMFPASDLPADFELADYDDNYIPYGQIDDESENYPLAPVYGYARDQTGGDSVIDFEEDGNGDRAYPFGRDTWFDEGKKDGNIDFMVLSDMYQGPRESDTDSVIVYGKPVLFSPDYEDSARDRTYYYGVPVYEEKERTRSRKENSLREFQRLLRQMEEERDDAPMNAELVPYHEDEVFWDQWQKRMIRSGRKNSVPLRKGFKMSQKRFYTPKTFSSKTVSSQNHNAKTMEANGKNKIEVTTSVPQPKTSPTGQKEYVLNRPAGPVRKPTQKGVYTRSGKKTDVYEAIKKLIAMEGGAQKENRPRIQKRFVLSEDQLTSQLSGLKRISV